MGLSGHTGTAVVGAATLNVSAWEFNETVELHDITTAASTGDRSFVPGLRGATGSLTLNWDETQNPFANPPNFIVGQKLTAVELKSGVTGGPKYTCDMFVREFSTTVPIDGKIEYTMQFTVTGVVTRAIEA